LQYNVATFSARVQVRLWLIASNRLTAPTHTIS